MLPTSISANSSIDVERGAAKVEGRRCSSIPVQLKRDDLRNRDMKLSQVMELIAFGV